MDNYTTTLGKLHLKASRQPSGDNTGGLDVLRTIMQFGDLALGLAGE